MTEIKDRGDNDASTEADTSVSLGVAGIPDTLATPEATVSGGAAGTPPAGHTAAEDVIAGADLALPALPVSAGALIFDHRGRLLILKPTYKSGWTIPGGVMEADGETPWQACQREVLEECGLRVATGRLACMDFRLPRQGNPGGIRYLFDCGALDAGTLGLVTLQSEEVSDYRLLAVEEALPLLRKPIRRRVRAATRHRGRKGRSARTVYLEDGHPVAAVRG
jgi:8-oxo-dGTP diphosphatase